MHFLTLMSRRVVSGDGAQVRGRGRGWPAFYTPVLATTIPPCPLLGFQCPAPINSPHVLLERSIETLIFPSLTP